MSGRVLFMYFHKLIINFIHLQFNGLTYKGTIYVLFSLLMTWILYMVSKRFQSFRIILLILSFVFSTIYIYWRTKYTLVWNTAPNMVSSLLLLGAEYLGFVQQAIFYILMSHGTDMRRVQIGDEIIRTMGKFPTVDVFVTTYNEPLFVLRRTLIACTYLDYPADRLKIYVCDDGDRTEVEQLAEDLGVFYIRRDDHSHAKAGNLNHALACSNGDLILTLDTDMVPKSYFLQKTVGYFQKRRVAFVQAPQLFFNPDPFQHNLSSSNQVSNEQDFFMIEMESAKSYFNATMYVGSNCIFSRVALNSIGGFATGCITEDVATGMLLQAKGYRTYFVKDVLARGLAAESFSEMLHQRERWCRGNLQAVLKWNPVIYPGLSMMQRLLYLSGALYWYFGVQKMVYIVSPIAFLDFGLRTLQASVFAIILIWLPQFYSSMCAFRSIARGRRTTFWSHVYETAMAPSLAGSALQETLHIKKLGFRVTKKGITNQDVKIVWSAFLPHVALFVATLVGFFRQFNMNFKGGFVPAFDWIVDFWALYNLVGIIMSIYVSIELPRPRKSERFRIQVPVKLYTNDYTYKGMSIDISENGTKVQLLETVTGTTTKLLLSIKGIDGLISVQPVQTHMSNRFEMRLVWGELPFAQQKQLIKILFDQEEDIMDQFLSASHSGTLATFIRSTKAHLKTISSRGKQTTYTPPQNGPTISH